MSQLMQRFVALDLHKKSVTIAAVFRDQEVAVKPRNVPLRHLHHWCRKNLRVTDQVVMETGPNTWHAYDLVVGFVQRVAVADARKLRAMAGGAPKTDKRDALFPARLLAVGMVPEVWVPPQHVREVRQLIAYRSRIVKRATAARNRLHSLLTRLHTSPPGGDPFGASNRTWWERLDVSATQAMVVRQDLETLDSAESQIAEVNEHLAQLSIAAPWHDDTTFVMQLPGFGIVNTMTVLSAIGTIDRFPTPDHLVGYSGLGARISQSGETLRTGRITKTGRRELRTALVQAAWTAVTTDNYWRDRFSGLERRIGPQKAVIAIARKLLVVMWHVLTRREAARHGDPQHTARKMFHWASKYRLATSARMSRKEYVRRELQRLGLGHLPITIRDGGWTLRFNADAPGLPATTP